MKSIFAAAALIAACQGAFATGIYHETFNDGRAQFWDPRPAEAFSIETSGSGNSFYRGSAEASLVQWQVSKLRLPPPKDFRYTVRVADNGVRPTYVIFRATANFAYDGVNYRGSGYAFGIFCGGHDREFYVYKMVDGELTTLQSWTDVSLKCSGDIDDADELGVTMTGDDFVLAINGRPVFRYSDPDPIKRGRVGFYNVSDDLLDTRSDFDHVVIGRAPAHLDAQPAADEPGEEDTMGLPGCVRQGLLGQPNPDH